MPRKQSQTVSGAGGGLVERYLVQAANLFEGGLSLLLTDWPTGPRTDASVKRRHTPEREADPLSWSSVCGVPISLALRSQVK